MIETAERDHVGRLAGDEGVDLLASYAFTGMHVAAILSLGGRTPAGCSVGSIGVRRHEGLR